jgi:hypothetical protein
MTVEGYDLVLTNTTDSEAEGAWPLRLSALNPAFVWIEANPWRKEKRVDAPIMESFIITF